jgi:transcriptional regulator with XRE-family HTH domain
MLYIHEICEKIKLLRKERKWSQQTLANKLGIKQRKTIDEWEKGTVSSFEVGNLLKLCRVFECDIGFFLGEHETRRRSTADISAVTGLSEEAVMALTIFNEARKIETENVDKGGTPYMTANTYIIDVVDVLLQYEREYEILYNIAGYLITSPIENVEDFEAIFYKFKNAKTGKIQVTDIHPYYAKNLYISQLPIQVALLDKELQERRRRADESSAKENSD